jgi:uncharacterized protein YndB with AHSA1/START domain
MADYIIEVPEGTQEVIITRVIHAPRDLVFRTATDPRMIPKWWGPRRLRTEVKKMNVTPGGTWRFVQTDKEGNEFAFHGVYHEVTSPKRLIYTSEYEGVPGHVSLYTDDYSERDGETTIKSRCIFYSVEDRDQMMQWGMEDGVSEMTLRMNELLAQENEEEPKGYEHTMEQMKKEDHCLTISRTFNAPPDQVWQRWTDENQYMCWWGPKDFTSPYAKFDLRPGGNYLTCMKGPDGREYWGTGTFEEIVKQKRIVYTDHFADAKGNTVAPSYYDMPGDQPIELTVQVNMDDLGGKTRLTLEQCGLTDSEMVELSKEGWNQSLDKLAECLR